MQRPRSPVQARNSRRVVDAARRFVEQHGLEAATMRRLATEADVSTRTLYNLFGDKRGLLREIVNASLDEIDMAIDHLEAEAPLERVWAAVEVAVDTIVASVPQAALASVLADHDLLEELARRWPVGELIEREIATGQRCGLLYADVPTGPVLEQFGLTLIELLRQWATGRCDADAFRAGALRSVDLCLLAVTRPEARSVVRNHLVW